MRRVVILRPEPGASATGARALERGLKPVILSLFEVGPVAWQAPDPDGFDALLLTSANAVRLGGAELAKLRGLPAHAVGKATADAARDAGFALASIGDSDVDQLLDTIDPELRLLHVCGEDRRSPQSSTQRITPLVVYRSSELPALEIRDAATGIALIHSPRAGRRFAELADRAGIDRGAIAIVAISGAAAESVGGGWEAVETAACPSDDALLALAARLCNKLGGT